MKSENYQTYLKNCECDQCRVIVKDGHPVCGWCRTPYSTGASISYSDEHFVYPYGVPVRYTLAPGEL